ncbi:MAG: hydrogenase assembly protein HypC [Desulfurococcales archaeon ex4484_58]|nr:MAG: hydrogenase assembly protein HypC [Desulfurococcales archaeon ex4484_58]
MCLGIPAEIIDIREENGVKIAKVKMGGVTKDVLIALEDVKPGDYVIVHAGVAIEKINEQEMKELDQLLKEAGII